MRSFYPFTSGEQLPCSYDSSLFFYPSRSYLVILTHPYLFKQPDTNPLSGPVQSLAESPAESPVENPVHRRTTSGTARYYAGSTAGNACGYTTPPVTGANTVSISASDWGSAYLCGTCLSIKGPDLNSVKAVVTDMCANCEAGQIGLSPDAYVGLSGTWNEDIGPLPVTWETVPCGVSSPILLRVFQPGFSDSGFQLPSIQAWDENIGIERMFITLDKSQEWVEMYRFPSNAWVATEPAFWEDDDIGVMMQSYGGQRILAFGIVGNAGAERVGSMKANFMAEEAGNVSQIFKT